MEHAGSLDLASNCLWCIFSFLVFIHDFGLVFVFAMDSCGTESTEKRDIEVFLGIWALSLLANGPGVAEYFPHVELMYFSGYVGYLVLGQYLMRYALRGAGWWYLLGSCLTIGGTYVLTQAKGSFDIRLYSNLTLNVALMAFGIFGIFQKSSFPYLWLNRIVGLISQLSFGIYFIHVIVLYYLSRAHLNYAFQGVEVGIPMTTIACLLISACLIFLLKSFLGQIGSWVN